MKRSLLLGLITLGTVLGDVSHVTKDDQGISKAFQSKNPKDFWWMAEDSPLKASYKYFKKCSAEGNCLNKTEKSKTTSSSSSNKELAEPIDLQKNIFLSGKLKIKETESLVSSPGKQSVTIIKNDIDLSQNPFLAHAANGDKVQDNNGFIGVQPSVPFKGVKKENAIPVDLLEKNGSLCVGKAKVCVPIGKCVDGVATNTSRFNKANYCGEAEVCCNLPSSDPKSVLQHVKNLFTTNGKSGLTDLETKEQYLGELNSQLNFIGSVSISTAKPIRAVAFYPLVDPEAVLSLSSNLQYENDYRHSNRPTEGYLPPVPTTETNKITGTEPECQEGEIVGSNGICISTGSSLHPTSSKKCGSGQKLGPYGECVSISIPPSPPSPPPSGPQCGPGQKPGPFGQCVSAGVPPSPPSPPPSGPQCGPGQKPGPYGQCVSAGVPPSPPSPPPSGPQCGPGQKPGPFGQCVSAGVPPSPPSPPPSGPQCGPGQKPGPFGQCVSAGVPPSPPSPPPSGPQCGPGQKPGSLGQCVSAGIPPSLPSPPSGPQCGLGEKIGPYGQCIPLRQTPISPPVSSPPSAEPRPTPPTRIPDKTGSGSNVQLTNLTDASRIPVGCAAALKCVQEIYCNADGFVSPVPVVLSPQQQSLKVATTACRDRESGTTGVCCRDPYYQDPWPSANLKNGIDDGQYAEDDSIGQYHGERK